MRYFVRSWFFAPVTSTRAHARPCAARSDRQAGGRWSEFSEPALWGDAELILQRSSEAKALWDGAGAGVALS